MLSLKNIVITRFKNYELRPFSFDANIVGISGKNGIGKTNLLDAVYFSCFTKSYFTHPDSLNIKFGSDGFRIESQFDKNGELLTVVGILKPQSKKEFTVNGVGYEKLSRHIGLFPCVMVAPDDIGIINNGSEYRRKYLDALLSQTDSDYLEALIRYNRILQQRNSFLKSTGANAAADHYVLDALDWQLSVPGREIHKKRVECCERLTELIQDYYRHIAGTDENISVAYESKLTHADFGQLLTSGRPKDLMMQRTLSGIHRDELHIAFGEQLFRNVASQGQKKSLLFAMKLAEFEFIRTHKGCSPILMLDDVFEKLDGERMHNMLSRVCSDKDVQVLITDTHTSRLDASLTKIGVSGQIIEL